MIDEKPRITIPTRLANTLIRTTGTADLETALWRVVNEYIELKILQQEAIITQMQEKWHVNFQEFERLRSEDKLGKDPSSWEVEKDFWDWEAAVTLLEQYKSIP